MTRQQKTTRQRAEEDLAVADRKVARLAKQEGRLETELAETRAALKAEIEMRDYLRTNPALPPQKPQQTPSTTNQEGTNP